MSSSDALADAASVDRLLAGYPVVVRVPVRWGELNAAGHVSNVVFFQYFELSRTVYLERMGRDLARLDTDKGGYVVASATCRYRLPVKYPDTHSVGTRVLALGKDRVFVEHRAVSHRLGKPVADGNALVVMYDFGSESRAEIGEEERAAIVAIEGREPPPLERHQGVRL